MNLSRRRRRLQRREEGAGRSSLPPGAAMRAMPPLHSVHEDLSFPNWLLQIGALADVED